MDLKLSDVPSDLNTLLAEWVRRYSEFTTHVKLCQFERVTLDGETECHQTVCIYTENQEYAISARWGHERGYLGCIARARKPRAGEDHRRGSDLADGPFTYETWFRILADIVSYELVRLAKPPRPTIDELEAILASPSFSVPVDD